MLSADSQYAPIVAHGVIAVFGAIVHALEARRTGKSKTATDFFALVVMSSFSGAMFALVGLQFLPDQVYLTAALAGTGGYLGIEGMSYLVDYLKKRFKI